MMSDKKSPPKILIAAFIGSLIIIAFLVTKIYFPSFFELNMLEGETSLLVIFLTGLITGGLSCMAVQGGLLAATIAQREEERLKEKIKKGSAMPIFAFLSAKLVAYTIFGGLLGWFGSFFNLSLNFKIFMQIAVAVFMLGSACNILNLHPIFRYFVIQPPKFLIRVLRKQTKSKDIFAPALLGAFTVFIPCGTTQAVMAIAIASGKTLLGAGILSAFILGTSPVFFLLGYFATKLSDSLQQKFMKVVAVSIILLAIFNLNNAVALTGSSFTLDSFSKLFVGKNNQAPVANEATILIDSNGYNPNSLTVKSGSEVILHVVNQNGRGCMQAFTVPQLGFQKIIPPGKQETIVFTAPKNTRQIAFMCSMGMFRGVINVI